MPYSTRRASGTATVDPLVGSLLDGRYDMRERIARGGMASVYRALDTRLDRVVAVKVMHSHLADDDCAARFVREARAAARLNDPGVVAVFDQGEDDGTVFLAMELVAGRTLRDVVRDEAPLAPARAVAVVERVASALAAAHAAGIVHHDVKPENVLLGIDGAVKVADFGLARALEVGTGLSTGTAPVGLLMGTVSYLAPELVLGLGADARSDVYSLGIVAYELLTGRKPHVGETPIQVAYQHVHADVPAPSGAAARLGSAVPDYVDALVERATARDRDLRPTDAGVLVRQLAMVRSALAEGVASDPELARDLRPGRDGERAGSPRAGSPRAGSPRVESARAGVDDEPTLVAGLLGADDATHPPPRLPRPRTRGRSGGRSRDGAPADAGRTAGARRRRRGRIMLAVVLALAVAAGGGGWWYGVGRFTDTPSLLRMSERQARAAASDAGLTVDLAVAEAAYSERVPEGAVLRTEPAAGERIADGGTVTVVLSLGKERYPVPELAGSSPDEAVDRLVDARLEAGKVRREYAAQVPAGDVSRASIAPETMVRPGTEVDMWVSRGPRRVAVPGVVGAGVETATAELTDAGFTVSQVQTDLYAGLGLVVQQSPGTDELAPVGSEIIVYLV